MAATLYVVATPLGNLGDLSQHAWDCLRHTPCIYAEDTRRSRILLNHGGIATPLRSLHTHNELKRCQEVLAHLAQGDNVALLTDAGTPAIRDPGADVVAAAHRAGHRVSPVVGPSALSAALSVAGFSAHAQPVVFYGFLPRAGRAWHEGIASVVAHRGVGVLFESPQRLASTLAALARMEPQRLGCVCREMTKIHEQIQRGCLQDLAQAVQAVPVRGEVTVVVGPTPRPDPIPDQATLSEAVGACLQAGLSPRDTACAVAAVFKVPKAQVYKLCVHSPLKIPDL